MAKARVELSREAERALTKIYRSDRKLFERVDRALDRLSVEPQAGKQLHGPLAAHAATLISNLRDPTVEEALGGRRGQGRDRGATRE